MKYVKFIAVFLILNIIISAFMLIGQNSAVESKKELSQSSVYEKSEETLIKKELSQSSVYEKSEETLILYLDTQTGCVKLEDKLTGKTWTSNPSDPSSDPIIAGEYKTKIKSQLYVTYFNEMRQEKNTNSFMDSLNKEECRYFEIENGFRVEYKFLQGDFMIPVEYTLSDRTFTAKIVLKDIEEYSSNRINRITLLPFFGSETLSENDAIFVPDGCGAIIEAFNGKSNCEEYVKRFYSEDASVPTSGLILNDQELLLPVFGILGANGGFLARVSSGAELASLHASPAFKNSSYSTVNTSVEYCAFDRVSALETDRNSAYAYMPSKSVDTEYYTVDYTFCSELNTNIGHLADIYRGILEKQLNYADNDNATQNKLYVDLYGAIRKKTSFLGIVYTGNIPVTTFSQMQDILDDLKGSTNRDISARILHYSEGELLGSAGKAVEPIFALGGKKKFFSFLEWCEQNNIDIYSTADISTMKKGSTGFSVFKDVISGMNKQPVKTKEFDIITNSLKTTGNSRFLLSNKALKRSGKELVNDIEKYGISGICFTSAGNTLYSDYGTNLSSRTAIKNTYINNFEKANKKAELSYEGAYEYMLPYAKTIFNVPVSSSRDMLFDYDVPFYQMTIMGKSSYSADSFNLTNPSTDYFLACVETLSAIKFTVGDDDNEVMNISDMSFHNIAYSEVKEKMLSLNSKMSELSGAVEDARLINFEREGDVSEGVYDNGVTVFTNRGTKTVSLNGVEIPAQDFVIIKR